jgi:hypothetical protein
MNHAFEWVLFALWIFMTVTVPLALVWGWVRWAKRKQPLTVRTVLSLAGFVLATTSALLAIVSLLYAYAIGGFPFYDPRLLRIYRWGVLLSLAGTVLAIGGISRTSAVRWHAPFCALGMLVFWFVGALGE